MMMYNKVEVQTFANFAATTATFNLRGGRYGVDVVGTFNSGTIILQKLAFDGVTWVLAMTAFSVAGYNTQDLPSGTYRLAITGSPSAMYAQVVSISTVM